MFVRKRLDEGLARAHASGLQRVMRPRARRGWSFTEMNGRVSPRVAGCEQLRCLLVLYGGLVWMREMLDAISNGENLVDTRNFVHCSSLWIPLFVPLLSNLVATRFFPASCFSLFPFRFHRSTTSKCGYSALGPLRSAETHLPALPTTYFHVRVLGLARLTCPHFTRTGHCVDAGN